MISGFVMMATVGSFYGRADGWKDFAAKRLLRIVPMYWLATSAKLGTMLLMPAMILHAELAPWTLISSYLFLPSTNADGRFEPLLGVGWTLIFEMFFYAVFAAALATRRNVIAVVAAVLLACSAISVFRTPDWPAGTMYFNPIVLYFLFGMLLFRLSSFLSTNAFKALGLLALLGITVAPFAGIDIKAAAGNVDTMLLAIGIVVVAVAIEPLISGRVPKIVLFFAEASYVLYLFHPLAAPIVPEVLRRVLPTAPTWVSVVMCITLALIVASIIHVIIEKPVTKWLRDRLFKPKQLLETASA